MVLDVPDWQGAQRRCHARNSEDPPVERDKQQRRKGKEDLTLSSGKKMIKKEESAKNRRRHPERRGESPAKRRSPSESRRRILLQQVAGRSAEQISTRRQQQQKKERRVSSKDCGKEQWPPQKQIEFVKDFRQSTDKLFSYAWNWNKKDPSSSSSTGTPLEDVKPAGIPSVVFAIKDNCPSPLPESHGLRPRLNPMSPTVGHPQAPIMLCSQEGENSQSHFSKPSNNSALGSWRGGPVPYYEAHKKRRPTWQELTRLESSSTHELEQNHQNALLAKDVIALPRLTTPVNGVSYLPRLGQTNANTEKGGKLRASVAQSHASSITQGLEAMRNNLREKQAKLANAVSDYQSKRSAAETASLAEKIRATCHRQESSDRAPNLIKNNNQQPKSGTNLLSDIFADIASKINFGVTPQEQYLPKVDGILSGTKSPPLYLPFMQSPHQGDPVSKTHLPFRPSAKSLQVPRQDITDVADQRSSASLEIIDVTSQAPSRYQKIIREEMLRQQYEAREREHEKQMKHQQLARNNMPLERDTTRNGAHHSRNPIDITSWASSQASKSNVKEIFCVEEDSHGRVYTRKQLATFPRLVDVKRHPQPPEEEIEIEFSRDKDSNQHRGLFDGIWDREPSFKKPTDPSSADSMAHTLPGNPKCISSPCVSPTTLLQVLSNSERDRKVSSPLWNHFVAPPSPKEGRHPGQETYNQKSSVYDQVPFVTSPNRKRDAPINSHLQRDPEGTTRAWNVGNRESPELPSLRYRDSTLSDDDEERRRLLRPRPLRKIPPSLRNRRRTECSVETRSVTFRGDDSEIDEEYQYVPHIITTDSHDLRLKKGGHSNRGRKDLLNSNGSEREYEGDESALSMGAFNDLTMPNNDLYEYNIPEGQLMNRSGPRQNGNVANHHYTERHYSRYHEVYGRETPLSPVIILDDEMDQVYEVVPADVPGRVDKLFEDLADSVVSNANDSFGKGSKRWGSDGESSITASGQNVQNVKVAGALAAPERGMFFDFLCATKR